MPYRTHKAYSSIKRKNQQLRHLRDSGFLLLPMPHPKSIEMGGDPNCIPRFLPKAKHRGQKNQSGTKEPVGAPRAKPSLGLLPQVLF